MARKQHVKSKMKGKAPGWKKSEKLEIQGPKKGGCLNDKTIIPRSSTIVKNRICARFGAILLRHQDSYDIIYYWALF
jgi:hypothetical protein